MDALWLALAVSGVVCMLVGTGMPGAGSVSNLRGAVATVCVVLAVALTVWRARGSGTGAAPVWRTHDRLWRGLAAGTGLAGAGLAAWVLVSGVGSGLLDPAVSVYTVGAVAATAGAVGAASRAPRSRPGPARGGPTRWLGRSLTGAARLLPRLLAGRTSGPVFLTDRAAKVELAAGDLDAASGRARLSYRRAAELFTGASGGATLHQLRHSALTHAAEDGANTSTLLAYSGHTSVVSLARYARVSPEALGRWQAERDPARRR